MKDVLIYQPPADPAQVSLFIESLEPKLREKLLRQIIPLPRMPPSILREPHYKHFTLERYRSLYEVRAKGGIAVRVIFTILPEGRILLLCGFVKKQSRDTMRALEQSLRILSALRDHPEYAVEYTVKEPVDWSAADLMERDRPYQHRRSGSVNLVPSGSCGTLTVFGTSGDALRWLGFFAMSGTPGS